MFIGPLSFLSVSKWLLLVFFPHPFILTNWKNDIDDWSDFAWVHCMPSHTHIFIYISYPTLIDLMQWILPSAAECWAVFCQAFIFSSLFILMCASVSLTFSHAHVTSAACFPLESCSNVGGTADWVGWQNRWGNAWPAKYILTGWLGAWLTTTWRRILCGWQTAWKSSGPQLPVWLTSWLIICFTEWMNIWLANCKDTTVLNLLTWMLVCLTSDLSVTEWIFVCIAWWLCEVLTC